LQDRFQRVARLGDVREVKLRLQLIFASGTTRSRPRRPISTTLLEMRLHLLRFFYADGTGVCFLFGDTDLGENVQDGLTLDFQFSRQVIDSNLIHPPSIVSAKP
jgi:hypothetical protein